MKEPILYAISLFIAFQHICFAILEMFLWDTKLASRIFKKDRYFLKTTRAMAANQGLYNSFLAAGIILALSFTPPYTAFLTFFLACVFVAGVFGAITVSKGIFFVQALPAMIALALCLL